MKLPYTLIALAALAFLFGAAYYGRMMFGLGGLHTNDQERWRVEDAGAMMAQLDLEIEMDLLRQYRTVSERGNHAESYVRASLVAEHYLRTGDADKYNDWRDVADRHNADGLVEIERQIKIR